eukprot:Clim_evm2s225 gene=Clim_evmTU2s225
MSFANPDGLEEPNNAAHEIAEIVREFSQYARSIDVVDQTPEETPLISVTTLEGDIWALHVEKSGFHVDPTQSQTLPVTDADRLLAPTEGAFDSFSAFLDTVSPAYRQRFAAHLASKLSYLQQDQEGENR